MSFRTLHEIGRVVNRDSVPAIDRNFVAILYRLYAELRGAAIESGRLLKDPERSMENQRDIAKRVIEIAEKQAAEYPLHIPTRNEERLVEYVNRALEHAERGDMRALQACLKIMKDYL